MSNKKCDVYNLHDFDMRKLKIQKEIKYLIRELRDNKIPTRDEMIRNLYASEMINFDFIKGSDNVKNKKGIHVDNKSKREQIEIILNDFISESTDDAIKETFLKQILNLIDGISKEDKKVLLQSLKGEKLENLKQSIRNLVEAFSIE